MKQYAVFTTALGLALGSLQAQTVPLFINYQGRITGSTGIPLGSTGSEPNFTAAPTNRKVIFRIFDAQTGGNRLWSEQQTVTISLGEFSVLLGQGTDAVYNAVTESRPALDSVFASGGAVSPAGPTRFLEIVVDDGNGTFTTAGDLPITPRQRITTTAYSFRSRVADTVPASAIDANAIAAGAVNAAKIADNAVTTEKIANLSVLNEDIANSSITSAKIADLSIATDDLSNGAVNSLKIADLSVGTADLANASVTAAKLDGGIGLWSVTGGNVFRAGGAVGIGKQPAANVALDVVGQISASGNLTTQGTVAALGDINTLSNINATGTLTAGNITTPGNFNAANLNANGFIRARGGAPGPGGGNNNGFAFSGNGGDNDSGMYSSTDGQLEFYTNAQERIRILPTGLVGIGTTAPTVPLDVAGNVRITMTDNGYISGQGNWATIANTYNLYTLVDSPARQGGEGPEIHGMSGSYGSSGGNPIGNQNSRYSGSVAIRASGGWIASSMGIIVYSDRRIKRDATPSVTAKDLATIQKLRVTDYRMVDPGNGGMDWRKGFIAQEVEEIIPGAVTRSTEFVPDIFSVASSVRFNAEAKTLTVTLSKDHGLKTGERVRLHMDGNRLDMNVSAVPSARVFTVDKCERAPEKVLVYGRQVNDFRTVDYDRIFTTSVGALQELKKEKDAEVKALREENASLRTRLAALEANDKARDAKLAAIENLLASPGKSAPRTVALKARR